MADPILELSDVSLSFKGLKAIDALSFSVERGEICALIGPNGAGKSSALNILNGVYRADSGHARAPAAARERGPLPVPAPARPAAGRL